MKVGFIGFGHMAQALFQAMAQAQVLSKKNVLFHRRDQEKAALNELEFGIKSASLETLVQECDFLLLGVKPQQAGEVLSALKKPSLEGKILISILAGAKISALESSGAIVVRTMPNLCSLVNEGMTAISFGKGASSSIQEFVLKIFRGCGQVVVLDEKFMDIFCGMAGSGPGFVFRLIDAMARCGESHGMDREQALLIAAQTFYGAAKMILKDSDPAELAIQIATPNGTTQAGFESMDENRVEEGFQTCIEAASKRSSGIS